MGILEISFCTKYLLWPLHNTFASAHSDNRQTHKGPNHVLRKSPLLTSMNMNITGWLMSNQSMIFYLIDTNVLYNRISIYMIRLISFFNLDTVSTQILRHSWLERLSWQFFYPEVHFLGESVPFYLRPYDIQLEKLHCDSTLKLHDSIF